MDHLGFTFRPRAGAREYGDSSRAGCTRQEWPLKDRLQTFPPDRSSRQTDSRDNHTPQVKDSPLFTGISIVCTPPDVFTLSGLSWLGIVRTACWGLDWLEWIFNNPKISWKIRPSWRSDASLKFLPSLAFTFSHSRTFLGHLLFW